MSLEKTLLTTMYASSQQQTKTIKLERRLSVDNDNSTCSTWPALCWPGYTFKRIILLTVCILGVVQYAMILTNGITVDDFDLYYGITAIQGDNLYALMNFGACALSFIPGILYDNFGCVATMVVGTLIFDIGCMLQLMWTPAFSAQRTIMCLSLCYTLFGFASSFFNVIGSFAPLVAFEGKDAGKVSACVQVSMSLGITIQSAAYFAIKHSGGDFVNNYMLYALLFTNVAGVLMCMVFRACHTMMTESQSAGDNTGPAATSKTLKDSLSSPEFVFMWVLFFFPIGFSFSFLNCAPRLAKEAGADPSSLTAAFGILNALGRLAVNVPLDYTRKYVFGGVFSYIIASLLVFSCGIMFLACPSSAGPTRVSIANGLVSVGYGGILGIVPPTLRIFFGTENLGVIYGLLYVAVSISEPMWGSLFYKPVGCTGVGCYRLYHVASLCGFLVTLIAAVFMQIRQATQRKLTSPLSEPLQGSQA